MNHLKTSIFALIAVLTMSFTVAEHKGIFKDETPVADLCIQGQDATTLVIGATTYQRGVSECTSGIEGMCATIATTSTTFECAGTAKFCCAKLSTDCPGQQQRVDEVLCQP